MCVCVFLFLGDLRGRSHQSRFLLNSERAKMAIYQRDRAPSIRMPHSGHTSFPDQYPSRVCVRAGVCVQSRPIALLPVCANYSPAKTLDRLDKRMQSTQWAAGLLITCGAFWGCEVFI